MNKYDCIIRKETKDDYRETENLGALFVVCCDVQKSPKIRCFRTNHKSPFILFFAKFLHP